jgi:putative addiction module CopG family antidote
MANIALGAHYEKFVQGLLDEGRYSNASEVVQGRLAAHQANPGSGIPTEEVHRKLRERMASKG